MEQVQTKYSSTYIVLLMLLLLNAASVAVAGGVVVHNGDGNNPIERSLLSRRGESGRRIMGNLKPDASYLCKRSRLSEPKKQ